MDEKTKQLFLEMAKNIENMPRHLNLDELYAAVSSDYSQLPHPQYADGHLEGCAICKKLVRSDCLHQYIMTFVLSEYVGENAIDEIESAIEDLKKILKEFENLLAFAKKEIEEKK